MAHIYIIRNSVNDKCYIGQTKNSIEHRFKSHKSQVNCKNQCTALYAAIRKYGADCFFIESLASDSFSRDELNVLEVYFIDKYKTLSPGGYNLQTGGGSFNLSQEVRDKISSSLKGRSMTWADKISLSVKKLWEDSEYRERQVKQRREKRGSYREGIVRMKLRKQINIDDFKKDYSLYMNLQEMSKKYGISVHTIYKVIKREGIKKRGYKCNQKTD